ncbi:hypothetical protein VSP9026_02284 [Vibrio spartinae]|uniref:Uncharacterized protein n=1 Tax=Vibrio spartinae TaxID=1918945 RepID=A0A1N6M538_9VIBR|nr:hypothetical protein VSP9026_02284 [Vibrio spartinae]
MCIDARFSLVYVFRNSQLYEKTYINQTNETEASKRLKLSSHNTVHRVLEINANNTLLFNKIIKYIRNTQNFLGSPIHINYDIYINNLSIINLSKVIDTQYKKPFYNL